MASYCLLFVLFHVFETEVLAAIKFTPPHQGQAIRGTAGSSVNFTWKFSGDVGGIEWGIKKDGSVTDFQTKLLSLDISGILIFTHQGYTGRVNGSRTGDLSSAQVIFTLSAITTNDAKSYLCVLKANNFQDSDQYDHIKLVVEDPPIITWPISANASYNERSRVTISCTATGTPDPDVKWIRNAEVKSSGVKKADLTFNSISKAEAGQYTCRANNSVGSYEKQLQLIVKYQATIHNISSSVSKSWIGRTVTLTCNSDGVPTPTLSWYKPDGNNFNSVKAKENTVSVTMKSDDDFGFYNCTADNGFVPASMAVFVHQIKAPGSPIITTKDENIQANFMTVKWDPPADNGGSPITAYRVVILQSDVEIRNKNVTMPAPRSLLIENLNKSTSYTVKVLARNYVFEGNATEKTFQTRFKGIPAAVDIDLLAGAKEDNVTIKWNTPKDGGDPITQYTVYQRTVSDDGTPQQWIKIKEIKELSNRVVVVPLKKGKKYEFVVTATNGEGESLIENDKIKRISVGDVPEAVVIKDEVNDVEITLKWEEPDNKGANITQYDVYQKTVNDEWKNIRTIQNTSKREFVVEGKKGEEYEFAVTATNKYGESSKEDSSTIVKVPEGKDSGTGADTQSGGMSTSIIAGVAAVGVLLIVGLIIFVVWWKRRKTPRDDASSSGTALRSGNEIEDGYQDVSPAAAAQGLQASGPVAEPNYAEVDVSQKKKNRRPVTDEYAQVDKTKKTKKKPKKQPGELDYAELDDLRPRPQPAPVPSGANARPVVRPPAYEGTLYADIAQFGVPQPEPTYDNMPRKDVVYSNVERAY